MISCNENHLYIGADNPIELIGLYNADTAGQPAIIDAVVTVTGTDSDSIPIVGVTWPLTLAYDATNDRYWSTLPAAAELVEDGRYTFTYSVNADNRVSTFSVSMYAEYRENI